MPTGFTQARIDVHIPVDTLQQAISVAAHEIHSWHDENKTGSITFHFSEGHLTKFHREEYVKVTSR